MHRAELVRAGPRHLQEAQLQDESSREHAGLSVLQHDVLDNIEQNGTLIGSQLIVKETLEAHRLALAP